MWLNERLHLQISDKKSKIVNLKKNYSEFLGFKMKVRNKGKKKVVVSHISDKSKKKIKLQLKNQIKKIQKSNCIGSVNRYNAMVLGTHNYYKIATHINRDLNRIAYDLSKSIHNRTKAIRNKNGFKSKTYRKLYGKYKMKITYIAGIALFPIDGIRTKPPRNFSQDICNYTASGRTKIHSKLSKVNYRILKYLLQNSNLSQSIEYNDNRISLYIGQNGRCVVSGVNLTIGEMEVHHIKPKKYNGDDSYNNLIYINSNVHKLIHCIKNETIKKYKDMLCLNSTMLKKINKFRIMVGNFKI